MDRLRDYHTKWSKPDRETQISHDMSLISRIWTNDTKWIYVQNRNKLTDIENKCMVTKEEGLN